MLYLYDAIMWEGVQCKMALPVRATVTVRYTVRAQTRGTEPHVRAQKTKWRVRTKPNPRSGLKRAPVGVGVGPVLRAWVLGDLFLIPCAISRCHLPFI
jgi:hypothetical protein